MRRVVGVTPLALTAIEPERWVLVFQRESKVWWVRLLACGKYKHVAAYAYLPGFKAWLIYDVNMCARASWSRRMAMRRSAGSTS
jgi:hypothetical protein